MGEFGRDLGRGLRPGDLLVLTGPLGAGKTTLTRGIGAGLGVRGPVQSPTFVIARTHPNLGDGPPLIHVDAYRLGEAALVDDLDLDVARSVVVVEWGAGLVEELSDSRLEIVIERPTGASEARGEADGEEAGDDELDADEPRTVTVRGIGPRWAGTLYAVSA
ncbi:tRNA (adenosine(37)-N6)-threonylcarbamoyltransferase complex ATPase subunit type 1 TsaE [Agromyces italicus]|uniref:tRNA (adenosine(37)-N6)-threonylcarbamoyltransferase complex ATPase subunit type 1 TsaE n=1 Tax=Agromyces italicus TaxID=279572 RepID=UPI000685D1A2|nr:tRNA (adenosine(37)-N6)-threonylcarbamoyltransferase complex ATPase subunit type 1 TsaE [Agromyces italicus]